MANQNFLQTLLEQIHSSTQNVKKDIDEKDSREKTSEDLEQLTVKFQDLKEIISKMNASDAENLRREFRELFSGQEDFQTYVQDVKKILSDVQTRIRTDKKVEEKINNNLPEDSQTDTPSTLFQGFRTIIDQFSQITDKASRK